MCKLTPSDYFKQVSKSVKTERSRKMFVFRLVVSGLFTQNRKDECNLSVKFVFEEFTNG